MTDKERIDSFWFAVENSWNIERREYFEKWAPKSGIWSPEAMAVHHMWKRDRKPAADLPLDAGNCSTCRHGRDCRIMDETKCGNKYAYLLPKPAPDLREAICERQCADCPYPDRLCCECINSTFAKAKNYSGAISVAFWRRINAHGDKNLYAKACKLQELENEIHAAIREEG